MEIHQGKPIATTILVMLTAGLSWLALTGTIGGIGIAAEKINKQSTISPTPFPLDTLPEPRDGTKDGDLTDDIRSQMDQIQQQVIQVRGLIPTLKLPRIILSQDEHASQVEDGAFGHTSEEDASYEKHYLDALDIIDPDFDLQGQYQDMYTNGIAGYYDDIKKEMFVVDLDSFGINDRLTYAHEYAHALQDQNFDFMHKMAYTNDSCDNFPDRCSAIQALIEGDATLTEQLWQNATYTREDINEYISTSGYGSFVKYQTDYFMDEMAFPYHYGLEFVHSLYDQGGWPAVNAAYGNPPQTSEQILHPQKYPAEKALAVLLPEKVGSAVPEGFVSWNQSTMGEWELFVTMSNGNHSSINSTGLDAAQATSGWGGDRYQLFINLDTDETIFVQEIVWDTQADADEFFRYFQQYGSNRWAVTQETNRMDLSTWQSADEYAAVWQKGLETAWLVATDDDTRTRLLEAFGANP
jgi:hypothetical protein